MSRKTIQAHAEDLGEAYAILREKMDVMPNWTYITFKFGKKISYHTIAPVSGREIVVEVPEFFVHVLTRRDTYQVICSHNHTYEEGERPDRHIHIDKYVKERPTADDVLQWAELLLEETALMG